MLLLRIFLLVARMVPVSWIGGPASLALIQSEMTALGWLTPAESTDAVAPQVPAYIDYSLAVAPC